MSEPSWSLKTGVDRGAALVPFGKAAQLPTTEVSWPATSWSVAVAKPARDRALHRCALSGPQRAVGAQAAVKLDLAHGG